MALTKMEYAEMHYWESVVSQYMREQEDWRYPDLAIRAVLEGTDNQKYITFAIEYPVLRWRYLHNQLPKEED